LDSSLDDEVFPAVNILDTSFDNEDTSKDDVASKKDEDDSDETAGINSNDKRKLPETETEKKDVLKSAETFEEKMSAFKKSTDTLQDDLKEREKQGTRN
ncbi:hypothetical protein AALP_AAs57599U000100, partial [Arabis alpina]